MSSPAVGAGAVLSRRYRLLEPLASGGMGTVWVAVDLLLDRKVAIKEVRLPPGLDDEARTMLRRRTMREAQAAARLRHAAIVTVYDVVEQDDRPWIVMELVQSRSLAQVIREDGPLPPARVASIGLRILGAMETAQAGGVQHRDIKPANVLITDEGRVVLTDFGIARHIGDETLTSAGLLLGSPDYLAPERARGRPSPGLAADLWSLGALMYDAVEGRRPFEREGALPTLAAVVMDEPDPPVRAGPLRPVIDGLLIKDPAHRLDAERTRSMLERIVRGRSAGGTMPMRSAPGTDQPAPAADRPVPTTALPGTGRSEETRGAGPARPASAPAASQPAVAQPAGPVAGAPAGPQPAVAQPSGPAAEAVAPAASAAGSTDVPSAPLESRTPDPAPSQGAGRAAAAAGAAIAAAAGAASAGAASTEAPPSRDAAPDVAAEPRRTETTSAPAEPRSAAPTGAPVTPAPPQSAPRPEPRRTAAASPTPPRAEPRRTETARPAAAPATPRSTPAPKTARPAAAPVPTRSDPAVGPGRAAPVELTPTRPGRVPDDPDRSGSRRRPAVLAALALVALAIIAAVAIPQFRSDDPSGQAAPPPTTAAAATASPPASTTSATASTSTAPSSTPPARSATPTPTPAAAPTGAAVTPPAGFARYNDPRGRFSVIVPIGWRPVRRDTRVDFDDPASSSFLRIDTSDTPKADPYQNWVEYEQSYRQGKTSYRKIGISRVPDYRPGSGWTTADWEFTLGGTHVLDRNIRVNDSRAHAIYWSTPDSRWDSAQSRRIFDLAAASFVPVGAGSSSSGG